VSGRLVTLAVALAALACLGGAGPAAAAPAPSSHPLLRAAIEHEGSVSPRPYVAPQIAIGAGDGYTIEVGGEADKVFLFVSRSQFAFSGYIAPGTVSSRRLQASFGRFGRISMRFRPSRNRTWVKPHRTCRGKHRFVRRHGVFTGNLRFRGENGYVSVRIRRTKGAMVGIAPQCKDREGRGDAAPLAGSSAREPSGPRPVNLTASWRDGVSSTSFAAQGSKSGTVYVADSSTSVGQVAILRLAFGQGPPSQPKIAESLDFARVTPPGPFHGTATYRATPDGATTWQGSLSVNFPGAPRTPLTGEQFRARLSGGI